MKSIVMLLSLIACTAFADETPAPSLFVLAGAKVTKVTCHEQQHDGHDWSSMGEVELSATSEDGKASRKVDALILVSRFGDFDQMTREGGALCKQLKQLKVSGANTDILYTSGDVLDYTNNPPVRVKAIKGATRLLTLNPYPNG